MVDQRDKKNPKRPKRSTRKKPASKITQAQQAAVKARQERDTLRAQSDAEAKKRVDEYKLEEAKKFVDPHKPTQPVLQQNEKPKAVNGIPPVPTALQPARPLADPSLYGNADKARTDRLDAYKRAMDATRKTLLSKNDNAVYMGPGKVKYRNRGPQRINEDGSSTTDLVSGDDIQSKDELLSWLADPAKVDEIKRVANQAGLKVESYDDISKLWQSVVAMAASTYSRTSKKVTPWALIAMRGKYAGPDGKMQDKVTTSTQIDEMDPAEARGLFEQTATNMLGRTPSQAELDDFIAKAQMIARDNPAISTTRTKVGFDGETEQGTSQTVTKGGAQVVNAKAQVAASDMAKQSEDYGAFQAAGTYFPLLFDALSAPV